MERDPIEPEDGRLKILNRRIRFIQTMNLLMQQQSSQILTRDAGRFQVGRRESYAVHPGHGQQPSVADTNGFWIVVRFDQLEITRDQGAVW